MTYDVFWNNDVHPDTRVLLSSATTLKIFSPSLQGFLYQVQLHLKAFHPLFRCTDSYMIGGIIVYYYLQCCTLYKKIITIMSFGRICH